MKLDHESLIGLFADRVSRYSNRVFIRRHNGEVFTYEQAARRISGIAERLSQAGYGKGDRIACYLHAPYESVCLYLACAATGILPVPVGCSYSSNFLESIARQCDARAIFTLPSQLPQIKKAGLPVLTMGETSLESVDLDLEGSDGSVDHLFELAQSIRGEDLMVLQPTSGSTGVPKLVMRRNKTFPRAGRLLTTGAGPDDPVQRALLAQAMTHGGGFYTLATVIHTAAEMCIPEEIDTDIPLRQVEDFQPTYLYLAPRILRAWYREHLQKYGDAADTTPLGGGTVQWLFVGGAPTDEEIAEYLQRNGIRIVEAYGATEISAVAVSDGRPRHSGWAGKVLPDVELRIADDGECLAKTDYGMAGYWGNEELTRQSFTEDGFYKTGDRVEINAEGRLRYVGRKKDVFNTAEGSNIYPARIEQALEELPWVSQAILEGDCKPFVVAMVALDGQPPSPGQVQEDIEAFNQNLESFERIHRVALLPSAFSDTVYQAVGNGKIRRDRKQFRESYGDVLEQLYSRETAPSVINCIPATEGEA